jgi:potassium voltage-gated channel Shal-related subfamily D protein 1
MTTVGYGDMVVTSLFGKLFSACCAVIGVTSLLALPTTVVVNNFNVFYNTRKRKAKQFTKQFKDEADWNIDPKV